MSWVVGIDLGGTKTALGLVSPEDNVVAVRRIATNADAGPQSVVERIAQQITELEIESGHKAQAVGICCPGPVDHFSGSLLTLVNLPGLSNTPLRQLLADRLQVPVKLDHDAKVAALGEFYYGSGRGRGAQDSGVIATVKHFPGHGDTTVDTHRGLPTVTRSQDELRAIDFHPFTEGIKAGVGMVMTSHIIFSALDPVQPATLSPVILQQVLRSQMGFEGVIVSDSMNMMAMKRNYDPKTSVVQALVAGVDLIMLAEEHYDHNAATYLSQQRGLIDAVMRAMQSGEVPISRIDSAVRRVLGLKEQFGLASKPALDKDRALQVIGSVANRQVELKAARQAAAILRDRYGLLPIAPSRPIMLVNTTIRSSYEILGNTRGIGPNQTTAAFDFFAVALQELRPDIRVFAAEDFLNGKQPPHPDEDSIVVAVTENYPLPGVDLDQSSQPETLKLLLQAAPQRLVVVALRDPYELRYLPDVPTYLCAFSFRPCAAKAAAEVLCGAAPPRGRRPVSVPEAGLQA